MIPNAHTVSGSFDANHVWEYVQAIAELSGRADGVSLMINPVKQDLLARTANRTVRYAKHTTIDGDVTRRVFILVGADAQHLPVLESGVDDAQHRWTCL